MTVSVCNVLVRRRPGPRARDPPGPLSFQFEAKVRLDKLHPFFAWRLFAILRMACGATTGQPTGAANTQDQVDVTGNILAAYPTPTRETTDTGISVCMARVAADHDELVADAEMAAIDEAMRVADELVSRRIAAVASSANDGNSKDASDSDDAPLLSKRRASEDDRKKMVSSDKQTQHEAWPRCRATHSGANVGAARETGNGLRRDGNKAAQRAAFMQDLLERERKRTASAQQRADGASSNQCKRQKYVSPYDPGEKRARKLAKAHAILQKHALENKTAGHRLIGAGAAATCTLKGTGSPSLAGPALHLYPSRIDSGGVPVDRTGSGLHEGLDYEQRKVLQACLEGRNVFYTGAGGTGKTFVLRRVVRELKKIHGERGVVCCAPTGVAAILCGGQTLHSFVGCGVVNTVADFDRLWKPLNKTRWRAIKVEICCT